MDNLLRIIPPWLCGTAVTMLGHWGERRWFADDALKPHLLLWAELPTILLGNLIFLALLPTLVLSIIQPMIPFTGAKAGLAVAVAGYLFGLIPARLFEGAQRGWDRTFWLLLVDLLRLGGALTLIGWLIAV